MDITLNRAELNAIDMNAMVEYVEPSCRVNFIAQAGLEHYRLLTYFARRLGGYLVDIGTNMGSSAIALASNPFATVFTFDIRDWYLGMQERRPDNINVIVGDFLDFVDEDIIKRADLIFLDIDHSGRLENVFIDLLRTVKFEGLLLIDDIHHPGYPNMKLTWERLSDLRRTDLTEYGHISGTGAVSFGQVSFKLQ